MDENTRLSLAYQNLTDLPDRYIRQYANRLQEVDLSHNQFTQVRFLEGFPNLDTLILDNNNIKSHTKFPPLPNLTTLWLNRNKIDNLTVFVDMLARSFPALKYLCMMDNPGAPSYFNGGTFQQYKEYRQYVISQLPCLQVLDDEKIAQEERSEAERIFRQLPSQSSEPSQAKKRSKKKKKKRRSDLEVT
ncbi:leucine-rich melanocyte differentiation-associated protein-like [Saccoglossus kowalevskii]|uniref:Leucine-rich repeat-containing protein C10orf11 homolog n=1 Tax=Saccoglossus kowalevskii TaxID=10224 RepID=A0ABM0GTF9_SACKO|nr:PREDICTED: leucine-rich repeat-containing protein C10orf11 homolog [Saccoglossus kowalevskii]